MSTLKLNNIEAAVGTTINIAAGDKLSGAAGAFTTPGMVIQVQAVTSHAVTTVSGVGFTDFMSVAITPKFSSSKIHISCSINLTAQNTSGGWTGETVRYSGVKLFRDSTHIAVNSNNSGNRTAVWFSSNSVGDSGNDAYRMANSSGQYIDSPSSTSAITYKVQVGQSNLSNSLVVTNNSPKDDNETYTHQGVSQLTVMEIAQ